MNYSEGVPAGFGGLLNSEALLPLLWVKSRAEAGTCQVAGWRISICSGGLSRPSFRRVDSSEGGCRLRCPKRLVRIQKEATVCVYVSLSLSPSKRSSQVERHLPHSRDGRLRHPAVCRSAATCEFPVKERVQEKSCEAAILLRLTTVTPGRLDSVSGFTHPVGACHP
jgi:hypothetical protein